MKLLLDTHVLIWLFLRDPIPFSRTALKAIDSYELFIPSASILELEFLYEVGKIRQPMKTIIEDLQVVIPLYSLQTDFRHLVQVAATLHWTRDPFDRLIVAEAMYHKAFLLTKDKKIHQHFEQAIW